MDKIDQEKVPNNSDEISLKELIITIKEWWKHILSKWLVILIVGIIGAAIGLAYAWLKKPVYKAELSFALEDEKSGSGLGGALGLASQFGIDLGSSGGGAFSSDNLLDLMKSRSMVETALLATVDVKGKKETLAQLYIDFNNLANSWENKPLLKNIRYLPNADRSHFTLQQDSILGVFYKSITKTNLVVDKADKKSSIIIVNVNSKNELFSKYFSELLVKTVSDFYVTTKTKKEVQNVNILQRQTDSVRRELNSAIGGVASSSDNNPNANPSLQILRVPSLRRQVDVQANTAILGEMVKNLEISKVSLRRETPLIQVIDKPILPLEKERFGKAKGLLLGGFITAFITIVILTIYRLYIKILK